MDKQLLHERLEKLEAEQKQLQAHLNAYEGAIQEVKYWIAQLPPSLVDMIKEAANAPASPPT